MTDDREGGGSSGDMDLSTRELFLFEQDPRRGWARRVALLVIVVIVVGVFGAWMLVGRGP